MNKTLVYALLTIKKKLVNVLVEIPVQKKLATVLETCPCRKLRVRYWPKSWNKLNRHPVLGKGNDTTHPRLIGSFSTLQNIHASNGVWNKAPVATCSRLRDDVETLIIRKVKGSIERGVPEGVDD